MLFPNDESYETEEVVNNPDEVSLWHSERRQLGGLSIIILKEEPLEIKIPNTHVPAYSDACCCHQITKTKAAYYKEAKSIRNYRKLLQKDYDEIFSLLKWIELPGNQHEKVQEHNYLSYQLWLYSLAAVGVEVDKADQSISSHYEDAMIAAEENGMVLKNYIKPLEKIGNEYKILEQMSILIDTRIEIPSVQTISINSEDFNKNSILKGNKVRDFTKIHIYSRDLSKMQWTELRALSFSDQRGQIIKGVKQFIDNLKSIRRLLEFPLDKLKKSNSVVFNHETNLIPHIKRMAKTLKTLVAHEQLDETDEAIIKSLFIETISHVFYILQKGRNLVTKIWEIVLMTRLCYVYVMEAPESHIILHPYEKVLSKKFKKDVKNIRRTLYTNEDFFLVPCPDVLRKVPIVITNNDNRMKIELALHYEGHRNSRSSHSHQSATSSFVKQSILHTDKSSIAATVARNLRLDALKLAQANGVDTSHEKFTISQHSIHANQGRGHHARFNNALRNSVDSG